MKSIKTLPWRSLFSTFGPAFSVALLITLIALGGWMSWTLATREEPPVPPSEPIEPAKSRIVATSDLPAFTSLKAGHLVPRPGSTDLGQPAPNVNGLIDRYLLVNVKKGAEVKDEMVAPTAASALLANAVAVSIPTTATTFVGGQLRPGDLIDLTAVRSKPSSESKKFAGLLVLNIVQASKDSGLPNAIVLAIPYDQRDDFALRIAGADLLITRPILLPKEPRKRSTAQIGHVINVLHK